MLSLDISKVRNKTIIGLKFRYDYTMCRLCWVRNKTIMGLK